MLADSIARASITQTMPTCLSLTVLCLNKSLSQKLAVEAEPLDNYAPAEEYHQDYLKKNPGGYCHINVDDVYISYLRKSLVIYLHLQSYLLARRYLETKRKTVFKRHLQVGDKINDQE